MVTSSRTPLGAQNLRPLNAPASVQVQTDEADRPLAVRRRGWAAPRQVAGVQDRWRIDDEWWRERGVSRLYHALLLEDGTLLTVYHDLRMRTWHEQRD